MLNVRKTLSHILDALKVDYIVEESITNEWSYRKYNSGIAECWRLQSGSCTGGDNYIVINFPFSFIAGTSVVNINGFTPDNQVCYMRYVKQGEASTSTAYINCYSTNTYTVGIHVIGCWK